MISFKLVARARSETLYPPILDIVFCFHSLSRNNMREISEKSLVRTSARTNNEQRWSCNDY